MIPGLGPLKVHNALLYMAGILTVLAAYAHNFTTCALYAGLCGFAIGTNLLLDGSQSQVFHSSPAHVSHAKYHPRLCRSG